MKAAELLGLSNISFLEPDFESLLDDRYTDRMLEVEGEEALLLVDEEELPMAYGLRQSNRWIMTNFLVREPPYRVLEEFEEVGGRIFQEHWEKWMRAVREYYSLMLLRNHSPAVDDVPRERVEMVRSLIHDTWGEGDEEVCVDACCGSGVGSKALRGLNYRPISYDNDPSLLTLGISTGRILPEEAMCIDGKMATKYMGPRDYGIMLMAGTIDESNSWVWERIVEQLLILTHSTLVTVGNEDELERVEQFARGMDRKVETFENHRDPFYDKWVALISRD
ncbi:MAG: hypothetical protein ACLFUV_02395 [Methanomassiliicoccales archaeon]